MTEEDAIKRIKDFGLYHAIKDLPHSMRTVEAFEMAIEALKRQEADKSRNGKMNDLISRQAVLALPRNKVRDLRTYEFAVETINVKDIENLLSTQPEVKPRKGKWIVTQKFEDCYYAKCNDCKVTQVFYHNKALTNYCPNCGAQMER